MFAFAAPLVCFFLLLRIARFRRLEVHSAALLASVAWGVVLTGLTELLSNFHLITYWGILAGWSLVDLTLCAAIPFQLQGGHQLTQQKSTQSKIASAHWMRVGVVAILIITGFTALVSAP